VSTAKARLYRLTPQAAGLLVLAATAWLALIYRSQATESMGGTMELALPSFVGVWTLMMAAMMLPSVAPLASIYARSVRSSGAVRLILFASGYLLVWATAGIPSFVLASLAANIAHMHERASVIAAAAIFAWCGVYQFTPLKHRCLKHCRSPLSLLLHYGSYRGVLRDMRAGVHHGAYCLGCCWSLFILLIALGIMNVPAMVVLTAVVLVEKLWARGEAFSRAVAVVAFALAIAVFFFPDLASGFLKNERMTGMG
jgi:predicted metal-binding membrane protein